MVQAKTDYRAILWHHRWFALIVFAVVVLVAFTASKLQQPVYSVHAEIYVAPTPSMVTGNTNVNAPDADARLMNNQMEILSSDMVAARAVDNIQAELGKNVAISEDKLAKSLKIGHKEFSSVITLDMNAVASPKQVQVMMREYLRAYQETLERMNSTKSSREREFLEQQLDQAQQEMNTIAEQLRQFESQTQTYNLDTQVNQLLQLASGFDEQINLLGAEAQSIAHELESARRLLPVSADEVNRMARLERDPEIIDLRKKLIVLETERAEWASKVTDSHPQIQVFVREQERLGALLDKRLSVFFPASRPAKSLSRSDILTGSLLDASLAEKVMHNRIKRDSIQAKISMLSQSRNRVHRQLQAMPRQAVDYAALKNRFDMGQEKVRVLQKRLDDATLMQGVSKTFTKVEVLKRPTMPVSATQPNLLKNMTAATLLGLFLALFAVFARATLDPVLRWPFQLKGLNRQDVFTLAPLPGRKAMAAQMEAGRMRLPEANKRFLVQLNHLAKTQSIRRIGLLPVGDGADRAAPLVMTAFHLSEMANKVVMIDTDFSVQSITQWLISLRLPISAGLKAGPGLSEYLGGQTDEVIDIIYPLGKSVYGSIIPSGESLEDTCFQALQRPFSHLEQALSPNYHFVFYALPSIRQSYDAVALSRTLDGVIVLVYPGLSRVDELKSTLAELDAVGVPVLGIALQPA